MELVEWIDAHQALFAELSERVWEFAELGFTETRSTDLFASALEQAGFAVQRTLAGMPTALVGSFGQGRPVIALLGEFDALPGLSQEQLPYQKPREAGGNGHGCGHNLLGTASLAAAMAVQQAINARGLPGTVRFYGCPAEENGSGKTFMVKAGIFQDVDLSLCWHPDVFNGITGANALANIKVNFRFHGKASHAAYDPYNGRSALDAVELMDVGANYLREHLIPEARLHYVITNGGGPAANVVPPLAESQYIIRAPTLDQVQGIYTRVQDIARGAALMTGTEVEVLFQKGMSNLLLVQAITDVLYEKMVQVGPPEFSQGDLDFARQITAVCPESDVEGMLAMTYGREARALVPEGAVLLTSVMPNVLTDYVAPGSTDVGDVSWVTPTGQIQTTCAALRTPSHSWQMTAQAGMSIGQKGMLYAAKVLGLAALDYLTDPVRLSQAQKEFQEKIRKTPYRCPIPDGVKPF
jgi:aminobenzoyl-glutamate utilization protein B